MSPARVCLRLSTVHSPPSSSAAAPSAGGCAQIELPGVPLGSFNGSSYDEASFALHAGDVFVFCTDGVFEAMNAQGQEFTGDRLLEVVRASRDLPAKAIVEAIFTAVAEWR